MIKQIIEATKADIEFVKKEIENEPSLMKKEYLKGKEAAYVTSLHRMEMVLNDKHSVE